MQKKRGILVTLRTRLDAVAAAKQDCRSRCVTKCCRSTGIGSTSGVHRGRCQTKKASSEWQPCGGKHFLDVGGQRSEWAIRVCRPWKGHGQLRYPAATATVRWTREMLLIKEARWLHVGTLSCLLFPLIKCLPFRAASRSTQRRLCSAATG